MIEFVIQNNGTSRKVSGNKDLTILENIEKAGILIRNGCRKGLCGSCKMKLISGEIDQDKVLMEDGYIYSCVSKLSCFAELAVPPPPSSNHQGRSEKVRKARERALAIQKQKNAAKQTG